MLSKQILTEQLAQRLRKMKRIGRSPHRSNICQTLNKRALLNVATENEDRSVLKATRTQIKEHEIKYQSYKIGHRKKNHNHLLKILFFRRDARFVYALNRR